MPYIVDGNIRLCQGAYMYIINYPWLCGSQSQIFHTQVHKKRCNWNIIGYGMFMLILNPINTVASTWHSKKYAQFFLNYIFMELMITTADLIIKTAELSITTTELILIPQF